MIEVGMNHFILLSAIVLGLGVYTTASGNSALRIISGIAMIFTASLMNFAAFSGLKNFNPEGQIILFMLGAVILLIICVGAALAYSHYKETRSNSVND